MDYDELGAKIALDYDMRRTIENKFEIWMRGSKHKPLLVRGARQVGKTFSIREFGSRFFKTPAFFDLEKQRHLHQIFAGDLDPHVILPQLEAQIAKQIKPGESLLFLDEIQACPRALMALTLGISSVSGVLAVHHTFEEINATTMRIRIFSSRKATKHEITQYMEK